jgi:hypothetical protein
MHSKKHARRKPIPHCNNARNTGACSPKLQAEAWMICRPPALTARHAVRSDRANIFSCRGIPAAGACRLFDSVPTPSGSKKRVCLPFNPNRGAGSVTAQECDIVAKRHQFRADRGDERIVVAIGKIGPADRTLKQYVAQ